MHPMEKRDANEEPGKYLGGRLRFAERGGTHCELARADFLARFWGGARHPFISHCPVLGFSASTTPEHGPVGGIGYMSAWTAGLPSGLSQFPWGAARAKHTPTPNGILYGST
ncbi:predicted protein [Chaetomium globosum CBS 148.51]|uniref:Uncharacterized protein n=1 Tax=Chaetomium globosum (strain ATCC 6205 / CBS 148.51 / DSM 1962 / NBRC 6347 / NRRL 1970) TaxID=306901 RepID=Q2HAN5_CHAGB|nr:uncharacterized protein CHGG_02719 [Chaetomium globosum CBS 148.51]EAQ90784.1 predicted protein [Chaetomium globosum CBS 148.51]